MNEFELKLEVPAAREAEVREAVARLEGTRQRLRAIYFDTEDRALQRSRMTLRLRLEGERWVQTAKGDNGRALERLEHEVVIAGAGKAPPKPDLALHAGTPVGELLQQALAGEGAALLPQFETDVERTSAVLDDGASAIELAFDTGRIVAGSGQVALCELEFELKEGHPAAAVALARRWCVEHGLWLSTISKAEKGARMAQGEACGPPVGAAGVALERIFSRRRIAGAALGASLEQVIRNASELAAGSGGDEHIHQLRVGIRRTRTVLRELMGGACGGEEQALIDVFRELGRQRDAVHVMQAVEPLIKAAGGPLPQQEASDALAEPSGVVRRASFQEAILSLLGQAQDLVRSPGEGRARRQLARRLSRLAHRTLDDGLRFESLEVPRQHRVRKRLKRLRYLGEIAAPLFGRRRSHDYLDAIKDAQDALGTYTDQITALAHYRDLAARDASAWFAVGWLEGHREVQARACAKALRRLARARPFWE